MGSVGLRCQNRQYHQRYRRPNHLLVVVEAVEAKAAKAKAAKLAEEVERVQEKRKKVLQKSALQENGLVM